MSAWVVAMMLGVSTLLGGIGLLFLLWGLKTGQFEDEDKFLNGARYDGEEELRDAVMMEKKKKEAKQRKQEKNYAPPD